MIWFALFTFGVIIGSFINVLSLRYQGEGRILNPKIIGGRSHCTLCVKTLRWYELVPLFSFIFQGAKCRHCKHSLNWQYPLVELATGLLTAIIPFLLFTHTGAQQALARDLPLTWFYGLVAIWLLISFTLITLSAIDLRLKIIPDQSNALLLVLGLITLGMRSYLPDFFHYSSFAGPASAILGASSSPVISGITGALFAGGLFGLIIWLTKGRGMGLGDLKLIVPLGLILGWPDVLIAIFSAFVLGSLVGLVMILNKQTTLKGALPFGPFIVIGFYIAVFYSESLLRWYFSLA